MTENEFVEELKKINIDIKSEQLSMLDSYYNLLIEWNEKINLTTIINKKDVYLKHFYDSLTLSRNYDFNNEVSLCDVGTGAGFPGIVLKIVFPNIRLTLIEPLKKRCIFLEEVISKLCLNDVVIINDRAEVFFKNNRELFDVVTSRAVAKLNIICELCIAGVKQNGLFIPMKACIENEIIDLNFLKVLSCSIIKIDSFELPYENSIRNLIVIEKNNITSKLYPRSYDKIKKKPL